MLMRCVGAWGQVSVAIKSATVASVALFWAIPALADPPEMLASYSVNGGPSSIVAVPGVDGGPTIHYLTTITAPSGNWSITYDVFADLAPNPNASLVGSITVVNYSPVTKNFDCSFSIPLCPVIEGGSFVGGSTLISLTTQGAGSLTCVGSGELMHVICDGATAASLFPCPFSLATSGSGTLSSSTTFGLPGPNMPGPEKFFTIGVAKQVALTSLDTSKIQFTILYKDANGAGVPSCMGDINDDGQVNGADITYILTQWGSAPPCGSFSADLDESGVVDAADLAVLLTVWGPC